VVKSGLILRPDQDRATHAWKALGRAQHLSETDVICRILRLFAAWMAALKNCGSTAKLETL
jgi:hypothetical protein